MQQAWASLPLQVDTLSFWRGSVLRGEVSVTANRKLCWPHKSLEGPDARSLLANVFAWKTFVIAEYSQWTMFPECLSTAQTADHLHDY